MDKFQLELYNTQGLVLSLSLLVGSIFALLMVSIKRSSENQLKSVYHKTSYRGGDINPCDRGAREDTVPHNELGQSCSIEGHISWHEYFMSVAQLASKRSKDPSTKVGACIVNVQNKIVATGYNGMPNRIDDDRVPWAKEGQYLDTKYAYVVHAELNAILNSVLTDQTGCKLFVSLFPCNECAKAIIQTGIRHVIYLSDKHHNKDATKAAKLMFQLAGIKYEQYEGRLLVI